MSRRLRSAALSAGLEGLEIGGTSVETFAHSGALSISTVPRAATALTVVLVRVGPGGHISTKSTLSVNPSSCCAFTCYGWALPIGSGKHASFATVGAMWQIGIFPKFLPMQRTI